MQETGPGTSETRGFVPCGVTYSMSNLFRANAIHRMGSEKIATFLKVPFSRKNPFSVFLWERCSCEIPRSTTLSGNYRMDQSKTPSVRPSPAQKAFVANQLKAIRGKNLFASSLKLKDEEGDKGVESQIVSVGELNQQVELELRQTILSELFEYEATNRKKEGEYFFYFQHVLKACLLLNTTMLKVLEVIDCGQRKNGGRQICVRIAGVKDVFIRYNGAKENELEGVDVFHISHKLQDSLAPYVGKALPFDFIRVVKLFAVVPTKKEEDSTQESIELTRNKLPKNVYSLISLVKDDEKVMVPHQLFPYLEPTRWNQVPATALNDGGSPNATGGPVGGGRKRKGAGGEPVGKPGNKRVMLSKSGKGGRENGDHAGSVHTAGGHVTGDGAGSLAAESEYGHGASGGLSVLGEEETLSDFFNYDDGDFI